MTYNVNSHLENQIRHANTDALMKEAVLKLASSIVTDMQMVDARRERGDESMSRAMGELRERLSRLEAEIYTLRQKVQLLGT
jgi:TolA-binding protein